MIVLAWVVAVVMLIPDMSPRVTGGQLEGMRHDLLSKKTFF